MITLILFGTGMFGGFCLGMAVMFLLLDGPIGEAK
jgi:hypothetical protein